MWQGFSRAIIQNVPRGFMFDDDETEEVEENIWNVSYCLSWNLENRDMVF